jgi:archaellum component FlaC
VEEALKHQRELMLEGFKQMEKRFEQVDKRLEQVDKRFEQVDKRIEQVHQEIVGLHHEIKLLMRWSFGTLVAIGGLIVAVLRLAP